MCNKIKLHCILDVRRTRGTTEYFTLGRKQSITSPNAEICFLTD